MTEEKEERSERDTRRRDEKGRGEKERDEKGHDEKGRPAERGRRDEKGHHDEKGEKYRRDPMAGVFLGLLIVWAAALWGLRSQAIIVSGEWWQWFIIGLGAIFIIDRLIRYATPAHRRPMFGRLILGAILIVLGLSFIYGMQTFWPAVLAVVGIGIIVYFVYRARKPGS